MDEPFAKAYREWLSAKKVSDFSIVAPSLRKTIALTRKAIDLRDRKYPTYYTACLDDHEKGGSEAQLDAFFGALKERIVPLIRRIQAEGKPIREDFLTRPCPIARQETFSRYLLELEGLKKSALVLMTTEHPFTTNFGPQDVGVTTHYYEESFVSNICTTLHEGGHALFMQNEPEEFYEEHADDSMTNAMHECISRFYENLIGRSEAFVRYVYPKFLEIAGDTFADVSERELYEAMNLSRPGLNRCESDELTYSLHVMIRYELEKRLFNGDLEPKDLPKEWNRLYKEYLGVDVPDDRRGVLQDSHWASGLFGYFPSYALGSAYGAQLIKRMEQEIDVWGNVKKGNLKPIVDWLTEHIYRFGCMKEPGKLMEEAFGAPFDPTYYTDYLTEKYTTLYGLI
jgi:carboxypeptidase Taq